jgi:glycosyltransferase involved in cell wall biosynthesis
MRAYLIEPHAEGRISGGYLYNRRMAEGDASILRRAVHVDRLESELAALAPHGPAWLLLDSIFLRPEWAGSFLRLRRAGLHLGVLLHAFPSFIERAMDRELLERELPLLPTAAELGLLEELELLVAPGPYVPRLLAQCGANIRCLVCPPGVDHNTAPPITAASATVRLISLGGVTPLKGLADGLRALGAAAVGGWHWTIVGHTGVDARHVAELEEIARLEGISDRVWFAGQRDHDETLALLRQSDLVLMPSYTENAPLVALEALAAGVPVVGYAVGGLPDLIRDGETGLLAPLLDIDGLSQRLRRLIQDGAERQRLARASAREGTLLPSWEAAARDFAAALRDQMAPGANGSGTER